MGALCCTGADRLEGRIGVMESEIVFLGKGNHIGPGKGHCGPAGIGIEGKHTSAYRYRGRFACAIVRKEIGRG